MKSSLIFCGAGTLALALAAASSCTEETSNGNDDSGSGNSSNTTTNSGGSGGNPSGGTGGTGGATGGSGGVGAMGPGYSCDPSSSTPPNLALVEVINAADLGDPVQVLSPPGRPETLFIIERSGEIRIYDNGDLLPDPFLDVGGLIRCCGEEGLLGMAFHPQYEANGRFFIHYSQQGSDDAIVAEYARSASNINDADDAEVQMVITMDTTSQGNHNGGALAVDNNGYLLISEGDGGFGGDPECDANQQLNDLGKIMRVDVNGTPDVNGYPAAPGNPNGKRFHMGLRNPWRMSVDGCTGDLYIADVGQNAYEEVNVRTQAAGAANFGWPRREGLQAYPGYDDVPPEQCPGAAPAMVDPLVDYAHETQAFCNGGAGNHASISGGSVYRGSTIPALRGWYLYADHCSGKVRTFKAEGGVLVEGQVETGMSALGASHVGMDGNGEVYVVTIGGTLSRVTAQ